MTRAQPQTERPQPFRQFLLKVASRCNLACTYCYVYEFEDQSWRRRPLVMSDAVLNAAVDRIAEHTRAHGQEEIQVILHGGEPLLVGPERLDQIADRLRRADLGGTRLDLHVQTNGFLLDETVLDVFHRHQVKVGISLDGTASAHDLRRRRSDGGPTHARVAQAVALLAEPRHRALFSGLLGVVTLEEDPVAYYEAMIEYEPPLIHLLLPHGTWSAPPPGLVPGALSTPYGDWLVRAFDRWYSAPRQETVVRSFSSVVALLLGMGTRSESLGSAPVDIVTVETDGSIEQVDTLKVVGEGAAGTGLHVLHHRLDDALRHPGIAARQRGLEALSPSCRACPVVSVCGGGLISHRYRKGYGFVNPSVYCRDLYRFIGHVRDRIQSDVDALRSAAAPRRS